MTSSVVTLLKTGRLTLFLYQRILGNGDPVAEQLTRIEAPIFDTLNEAGGFDTNEGDSKSRKNKKNHSVSVCVHTRHYFTLISTYMSALYSFNLNMSRFFLPQTLNYSGLLNPKRIVKS